MTEILCRWLNSDLRISKHIEPLSLARDFSNGYLIGEILNKHQLQEDFHQFSKLSTTNAKLNNFTRLEPTLQLLGASYDLGTVRAVMQGHQGAATRLLHQLYMFLQKKKRLGLTGTAMETMRPAGLTRLHCVENQIFSERLRVMVRREADLKMQKIAQRFDKQVRDTYNRPVLAEQQQERRRHLQEQMRLQDIQKQRQVRKKQQDLMNRIQAAVVQIPKPPSKQSIRSKSKQRSHQPLDTQNVNMQIAEFEWNRKRRYPTSPLSVQVNDEQMDEWNSAFVQNIRRRLEEDAAAREQREKRRCQALIQQLHNHQTQEELRREEQLIGRLTRQSQQEKRIAVQLLQIRQQKEVLRRNRVQRERQNQDQKLRDVQQAQHREAALLHQYQLGRTDELRWKREFHESLLTERAQSKHLKHLNTCKEILEQILDLATKTGECRVLTERVVPLKLLREWKELFLNGKSLYETEQNVELEKLRLLNQQDYQEYTSMTGEWEWSAEDVIKAPPSNNDILGHVVGVLRKLVRTDEVSADSNAPQFPQFPLRACVLGNTCSGKSSCLKRIRREHDIHLLTVDDLIRKVLKAHKVGKPNPENEFGAEVEKILKRGKTLPDDLLISIIIQAIRKVPSDYGWVLDGFPQNISQARLLEKALGGADTDQEKERDTSHDLVIDTSAPPPPPPPLPVLHRALLLQVSDEQLLQRHHQMQQQKGLRAHPAIEMSPAQEQIQHRILDFQQTWPQLERWFGEVQNILVTVDAELDEDSVFTKVEALLLEAMDQGSDPDPEVQTLIISPSETDSGHPRKTSDSALPDVESAHTDPDAVDPDAVDPDAVDPDAVDPDAVDPDAVDPDAVDPDAADPDAAPRVYVDEPLPEEVPVYMVPFWDTMCSSYVSDVEAVMQNLREERNLIIHYLYNVREDYKQYLEKPDLKQEFVSVWQRDYNSVPNNMRQDEETKTELHQRLEDLRERLCDISEKRKEEALQEEAGIKKNGWLEDHTHLLINMYTTLMQVEVNRLQDTLHLLNVYYSGMLNAASETKIDLLEQKRRVFLITHKFRPTDLHEKQLNEVYENAVSGVSTMVSVEMEKLQLQDVEELHHHRENEKEHSPSTATSNKDKKGGKKKSPLLEEAILSPEEEIPEELRKRFQIRDEFRNALQHEAHGVSERLELLKLQCSAAHNNLRSRTKLAYRDLHQWSGNRFLSEIDSIDQFVRVARHYIEIGEQITSEIVLAGSSFFIDEDMRVVPAPPPVPRPLAIESTNQDSLNLTVLQLYSLHSQLHKIAPTGVVPCRVLYEVLRELSSLSMGSDLLPEAWMRLTDFQIQELVGALAQNGEMVDCRHFLLCAARPWPLPSKKQLIETYTRFKEIDTAGGGAITLQQYLQVALWFPSETELSVPDDPAEPLPFDRLAHLRQFFFTLFAGSSSPPLCSFVDMLLYFCSHPDPAHGFIRALSLLSQHPLRYTHTHTHTHSHSSGLLQSTVHSGLGDDDLEEECEGDEGEGVSVDDLLRAVNHHRIKTPAQSIETLQQDLVEVFSVFGYKPEEKILLSVLSKHPLLQDLIDSSTQYLLIDVPRVLQKQQCEEGEETEEEEEEEHTPSFSAK